MQAHRATLRGVSAERQVQVLQDRLSSPHQEKASTKLEEFYSSIVHSKSSSIRLPDLLVLLCDCLDGDSRARRDVCRFQLLDIECHMAEPACVVMAHWVVALVKSRAKRTVTSGLVLLVYALTNAATDGFVSVQTIL